MKRTTYTQRGSDRAETLVSAIFALGDIGYVALCNGQDVLLRILSGVPTTTTEESNFYEELLVNPTLLKLASQRANFDCEGLRYVAVGYGQFVQLILQNRDGHVSMGVASSANADAIAAQVQSLLHRHDQAWRSAPSWVLG